MPRFITVFLAVLAFGSFTALAWMLARPTPPDPRVATLESELQTLRRENARLRQQVEERTAAVAPLPAPAPPTAGVVGSDLSTGLASAPQRRSGAGNLREMMSTPGMRAIIEQQQAMQIDMGYGKLMAFLGLNDEERAHFKSLLLEREKLQTDNAMKLLDPNLTPEQRQQLVQEMQAQRKTYDDTIKAFLNDQGDYDTFKHWEDTQPERVQFDMMGRTLFASSGEPLSDQQEQQLIDLMARIRKSPIAPRDLANPAVSNPSEMTPEKVADYMKQLETMHRAVQSEAAGILSPAQVKTLEAYLAQARNMAETGMKTAQMMINQQ